MAREPQRRDEPRHLDADADCWMCRLNLPHRIPEQCDLR